MNRIFSLHRKTDDSTSNWLETTGFISILIQATVTYFNADCADFCLIAFNFKAIGFNQHFQRVKNEYAT